MRNDNYIDFGEEISRTVKKVLNGQEFYDLKHTINNAMRNVPGMGGGPFFGGPYYNENLPPLSKEGREEARDYRTYDQYGERYGRRRHRHRMHRGGSMVPSTLFLVFGSIGAAGSGVIRMVEGAFRTTFGYIPAAEAIETVLGTLFVVCLSMIVMGTKLRKRAKRFRLYQTVLNGRTYCTVKELAAASGREQKYIVKDLRKMIKKGMFTEGYFDEQETCLMTDYKTYAQYLETMKNAKEQQEAQRKEEEKWANREGGAELKAAIDEGKNYIRIIKEANDALPEEEISDKLDQLELVTTKIFDYVEQHPEKLPEIRKFMCYYMPITLKLVNAYQKFDQHGTDSSDIEATKLEIKGTFDTINKAYQNLLKKLMQTDILDVSSDISALETILAQEGLTDDGFEKKPGC
jgi:5-bromo-4-chloroindolyl phosphate hydrolysis protein.